MQIYFVYLQGKGNMRTFWLISEDDSRFRLRSQQENTNAPDLLCRQTSPVPTKNKSDAILNESIDRFQTYVQQRFKSTFQNTSTPTKSLGRSIFRQSSVPVDILRR